MMALGQETHDITANGTFCVTFHSDAEGIPEGVIQSYEEHEDSVYAVEWAAGDFWTFASLSYDGRLVINRVPKAVKYRQFLWLSSPLNRYFINCLLCMI